MKPKVGPAKVAPTPPPSKTVAGVKAAAQEKALKATAQETKALASDIKKIKTGQIKAPTKKIDPGGNNDGNKGPKKEVPGTGSTTPTGVNQSSVPSAGDFDPPQSATPESPITIMPVPDTPVTPPIKSAPIETVLFNDEKVSDNLLLDLLFEDIGGQELLTMSRHDTVNGQAVSYQPIKNLGILQNTFNPSNLLKLQETSDKFFANFVINLNEKIPKIGNGPNGSNYYITSSGDLVIEFVNLKSDEEIEIQIATDGTIDGVGI